MTASVPLPPALGGGRPGARVVAGALVGTVAFAVVVAAGVVWTELLAAPTVVVSLTLFAVGCGLFVWSFLRAVARSRTDAISVANLYFLSDGVPPEVRRTLLGALAVQTVVAVAGASIRPYTALAFGILVPVFGLGCCGAWAARHGSFPPRDEP